MWTDDLWQPNCSNWASNIESFVGIINDMCYSMGCVLGKNLGYFGMKWSNFAATYDQFPHRMVVGTLTGCLILALPSHMMTSSNGSIFRVTGHLCGEFTGHRWIPRTKGQWRGALMFSLICSWINGWVNNHEAGDLRRHRAHYDVTVIQECSYGFLPWLSSGSDAAISLYFMTRE